MKLHHVAIWTNRLEEMRNFYMTFFEGASNQKYVNAKKGFESYFITFDDNVSLEIMSRTDINKRIDEELLGLCHISFELDTKQEVLELTDRLINAGYTVVGEPRTTGDGMFESVVLDTDSNRVEICCHPN